MKKICTIVVALLGFVLATNAQVTEETMVIYTTDGSAVPIPVSYIDSIGFLFPGEDPGDDPAQNYPALKWTALELVDLEKTALSDETYTVNVGFDATCQLHKGTYYLLSEGLSFDKEDNLQGAGYIAQLEMPTYVITAPAQYAGYYVATTEYMILSKEDSELLTYLDSASCALGGSIVNFQDYATFIDQFYLTGSLTQQSPEFPTLAQNYLASMEGAFIFPYDAAKGSGLDVAMIKGGEIISYDFNGDDVKELQYVMEVEWLDGYYGLEINADGTDVVRPYNYVSTTVEYEALDLLGAPAAKKAGRPQLQKKGELKALKALKAPIKVDSIERTVKK